MKKIVLWIMTITLVMILATPDTGICVYAKTTLSDIAGHWAEGDVEAAVDFGYIAGYPDGTFQPERFISRAEFVKIINSVKHFTEVADIPFNDVISGKWYYPEVQKAYNAGYIQGDDSGNFRPDDNISRQEAAVVLDRFTQGGDADFNIDDIVDATAVSSWALSAVKKAFSLNYINGDDKKMFNPTDPLKRCEAVKIINRVIGLSVNSYPAFSYSDGIDENGFWKGVKALDYVEIFNYQSMPIPSDVHQISDDDVQYEIDYMLAEYTTDEQVTDRAVIDGDTVNIDYVGSVDGVEFNGGSTDGMGTDVIIGLTSYIDDFLEQLIGHMPGETINVEVTFPDDYGEGSLAGKDSVFITTINYIINKIEAELTDDFVASNLSAAYGWTNVGEMKTGIRSDLQLGAIKQYIQQYFTTEVTIYSVPDQLITYQENSMVNYYQRYADTYGMGLEEFLNSYVGFSRVDELIESNHDNNLNSAKYSMVVQAVAEDADIKVSDEDLAEYFSKYTGSSDYSDFEEEYGLPYLKNVVLNEKILNIIVENAVLL